MSAHFVKAVIANRKIDPQPAETGGDFAWLYGTADA